jgi:copper chaperone
MERNLIVDNIKCNGCANSIRKALEAIEGVSQVEVDIEQDSVRLHAQTAGACALAIDKLAELGYPLHGSQQGLEALGSKAKSFISCAVGKMQKD